MPDKSEQTIAFEIFMTGEAKELKGIARDTALFDQVIVCAPNPGALEGLKARAREALGMETLKKVTFSLIPQYLVVEEPDSKTSPLQPFPAKTSQRRNSAKSGTSRDELLIPKSSLEKSGARLELELENRATTPVGRRGRKPKTPLIDQVEEAYVHLNDLDWLQSCGLVNLPEVQQKVRPQQIMAEGLALRGFLGQAALEVVRDIEKAPEMAGVKLFLERYLQGKRVAEIAQELGVSWEWCSRSYLKEALRLAVMQFLRGISTDR
jgi:hypothetical protein